MSSRQNRMRQRAQRASVYVLQMPGAGKREFTVYVDSERLLGPRDLTLSKREAVRFAYCIASHPSSPLRVSYGPWFCQNSNNFLRAPE